jgi:hypothetical protein
MHLVDSQSQRHQDFPTFFNFQHYKINNRLNNMMNVHHLKRLIDSTHTHPVPANSSKSYQTHRKSKKHLHAHVQELIEINPSESELSEGPLLLQVNMSIPSVFDVKPHT